MEGPDPFLPLVHHAYRRNSASSATTHSIETALHIASAIGCQVSEPEGPLMVETDLPGVRSVSPKH